MAFTVYVQELARSIPYFTLNDLHTESANLDYFRAAQQYLGLQQKTTHVPHFPTSVTWRVDFKRWLEENNIECPLDFYDGENEVAFTHDMLILAAASLKIKLIPVLNCSMGIDNNPAYKMGLKTAQ